MGLDVENSIKYMFKDNDWKKKFLIGSFFSIGMVLLQLSNVAAEIIDKFTEEQIKANISVILPALGVVFAFFLISMILMLFISGYCAKNVNLRIFKPNANLLEWSNFSDLFVIGLKANIALCIYYFLATLIILSLIILTGIIMTICKPLAILFLILGILLILAAIIAIFVTISLGTLSFTTDLKFSSYFNFALMKKFLTTNFLNYFLYLLIVAAFAFAANMACTILTLTIIGIVLTPAIYFYFYVVQSDLSAQFIRETLGLENKEKAE